MSPAKRRALGTAWLCGGAAAAYGGVRLVDRRMQAPFRVAPRPRPSVATVLAVAPGTVTFTRTPRSMLPGRFRIAWDGDATPIGEILGWDEDSVTRRLAAGSPAPPVGAVVSWDTSVYRGDPHSARDLCYREIAVEGPLGPLPAWELTGARRDWIVLVHGLRGSREEALRILPALSALGFSLLVISYRNDIGAPGSHDGLYHLGDSEWEDLEAAVRHVFGGGAETVVLFGFSMGGSIIEAFLQRSSLAGQVRAAVLDSPLLNASALVDAETHRRNIPDRAARALNLLLARRTGIDFAALDHEHRRGRRPIPTLLLHSAADPTTPVAASDGFAARNQGTVVYVRVDAAGHTAIWNLDPVRYERAVTDFLRQVYADPGVPADR
jgi:pimeloyl-ACP methyl ester carboxylesterase